MIRPVFMMVVLTALWLVPSVSVGDNRNLETLSVFKDCENCPEMIVIPPGSFQMGTSPDEPDALPSEIGSVLITISYHYAMGRYEITLGQYKECVSNGVCEPHEPQVNNANQNNDPITGVSWHDANKYAEWLSNKTGNTYRLPSETEWEYAARGGSEDNYWWGNQRIIDAANCSECGTPKGMGTSLFGDALPVGSYSANPFGLFDTAGNVAEWILDCRYLDKDYFSLYGLKELPKDG